MKEQMTETKTISVTWPNGRAVLTRGNGAENVAIYPPMHGCLAHPGCPVFPELWAAVWWYPSKPNGAARIEVFLSEEDARNAVDARLGKAHTPNEKTDPHGGQQPSGSQPKGTP